MNNIIKITSMKTEHIPAVKTIEKRFSLSEWSSQDYNNEILREESISKVVLKDKNIVGFVVARPITNGIENNSKTLEIYNIAVSREFHKQGIGKLLLDYLQFFCCQQNITEIWLEVRESNIPAIQFYKKNNFSQIFTRKSYYNNPVENALVMRKYL